MVLRIGLPLALHDRSLAKQGGGDRGCIVNLPKRGKFGRTRVIDRAPGQRVVAAQMCQPGPDRTQNGGATPPQPLVCRQRGQPALRDFLAAIHRDLDQPVRQRTVVEPVDQVLRIGVQILPGRSLDHRRRLLQHQSLHQRAQFFVADRFMHKGIALSQAAIGQRRMRAIQHAQFGGFIRRNIGHNLRPGSFPRRARSGKGILDHPLAERLGHHRAFVAAAKRGFNCIPISGGRCRHDAINHAAWKCTMAAHPIGQIVIMAGKIGQQQAPQLPAIVGQIVA